MDNRNDYDLIIIGHGAAGLSAAVEFLEMGDADSRVAVLERTARQDRGGATAWTGAFLRIDEQDRLDPAYGERLARTSDGRADQRYVETLCQDVPSAAAFLRGHGVEIAFEPFPFAHTFRGTEPSLAPVASPVGGGKSIVEHLGRIVEEDPRADVRYETTAYELITDVGEVTGVRVRGSDGREDELLATTVVLACGGFEGDYALLTQFVGDQAWRLPPIAPGIRSNRGDALRMALEVGADTSGSLGGIHAEPVDRRSTAADAVLYGFSAGILVDAEASRFTDEGADTWDNLFEKVGYDIWRNHDQEAYWIGDATSLEIPHFQTSFVSDIPPVTSDTAEGLAEAVGLDPQALVDTVEAFNAATDDTSFDHGRFDGKRTSGLQPDKTNWAVPLTRPPYAAVPLKAAICFTYGGVRTDVHARVLSGDGHPIPGLLAAGEATGLFYAEYPPATSVLRSVVFGRRAARTATLRREEHPLARQKAAVTR